MALYVGGVSASVCVRACGWLGNPVLIGKQFNKSGRERGRERGEGGGGEGVPGNPNAIPLENPLQKPITTFLQMKWTQVKKKNEATVF